MSVGAKLLLIIFIFALAYFSWRFVETPFRSHGRDRVGSKSFLGWSLGLSAVIGALGLFFVLTEGLPQRFGAEPALVLKSLDGKAADGRCHFLHKLHNPQARTLRQSRGGVERGSPIVLYFPDDGYSKQITDQAAYKSKLFKVMEKYVRQIKDSPLNKNLSISYEAFLRHNTKDIEFFDRFEHPRLVKVKPHEVLCNKFEVGRCSNVLNGKVLSRDDDHLSDAGTRLAAPEVMKA